GVIQHHPHRSLAHLGGKLVRRLARHGSILSGVGASGKPGAVQFCYGELPESTTLAASLKQSVEDDPEPASSAHRNSATKTNK
ncbi:MAG: hypothetical protein ACOY6K_15655, partial [Pseudomonadota bacterium]